MRRSAAAIAITVIGMWLILSFKSSPAPLASSASSVTEPTTPAAAIPSGASGPPPAGGSPPSTAGAPAGQATASRTINGAVEANRYGDVQVAVVLKGSQIVDVKALRLPYDRARSADISTQAAPLLHDEVLQAQSARIDTIGGATYTSDGYARSLQSALDKANG
jgi:uncharacterized protein with FMN-binding domain